jgi:nitrate reductase NapE
MMQNEAGNQKKQELNAFLFLTVVLAPLLSVAIVGGYGLLIWLRD